MATTTASNTNYYKLKRCFYKEHPRVEKRTWDEIDRFLNLHQIKFSGFDYPKPVWALDEINFPEYIQTELRLQGITRPSAIQSMAWPAIFSGRDIMCIGLPTASRVLSYICPALVFVREQAMEVRKSGPLVLIVTQTKEVAKEIFTHAQMFIHQSRCTFCCLFDDENIGSQTALLREHEPDILIGNYHRLCELMDNDLVNLKNVSMLIMDDFYRNRSARLSDEIKRVANETRSDRQTIIFSRIVPSGLQKSNGDEFQSDAVFVSIGNDDIHVHNRDLPQTIHICTMAEKRKKLQDIISEIAQQDKNFKILVYANGFKKIRITEKIVKELRIDTFAYERTPAGRRRRAMKEKVYYNFNATPNSVLVASDVISSKVELPELNYIINADFPVSLSIYLNRMRMPNIRKYISIFIAEDARHADRLIYVLNECRQTPPSILYKISEAYVNSGKDVDRMPSLQEINDGLTKPVEKPIPKPLPPTVSSYSELQPRSLSSPSTSMLSSSCSSLANLNGGDQQQETETNATTNDSAIDLNSTEQQSTMMTSSNQVPSPTSSIDSGLHSISSISSVSVKRKTPPPPSPSTQPQTSTQVYSTPMSGPSRVNPSSYNNDAKRFKTPFHHHNNYYNQHQNRPSFNSNYQQNHYINRPRYPMGMANNYAAAAASAAAAAAAAAAMYNTPPPTGYYQGAPVTVIPSGNYAVYTNGVSPHTNPTLLHYQYATPLSAQSQVLLPPPPTTSIQTPQPVPSHQYYVQQPNMSTSIPNNPTSPPAVVHQAFTVKSEPQEVPSSMPYFTNPMPFKQEPCEPSTSDVAASNSNPQPQSSSAAKNDDAAALNIVSHLLKDQQILSRLEKVAQSFRLNST